MSQNLLENNAHYDKLAHNLSYQLLTVSDKGTNFQVSYMYFPKLRILLLVSVVQLTSYACSTCWITLHIFSILSEGASNLSSYS